LLIYYQIKGEKLSDVCASKLPISPFGNEGSAVNPIGSKSKLVVEILLRKVARLSWLEMASLDK